MEENKALAPLKAYAQLCEEYGPYSLQASNFLLDRTDNERFQHLAKIYRHIIVASEETEGLPLRPVADKGLYNEDRPAIEYFLENNKADLEDIIKTYNN